MKQQTRTLQQRFQQWLIIKQTRVFNWEYWPMWLVYLPAVFYFIYLCIRARSFFFFSAANPSIENGGMFFESKKAIFDLIPPEFYPPTICVSGNDDIINIQARMRAAELKFPVIAKPDRGERGWCVEIISDTRSLMNYQAKYPADFLLQTYIDQPIELSIFYCRHPHASRGRVTSVTGKNYLHIIGNGRSSIYDLITKHPRALLQLNTLVQTGLRMDAVPAVGEKVILVPFGNHVRGAMFTNECGIIDEALNTVINDVCSRIKGFNYGRLDIKCASIGALKEGYFSILELNGSGAEPAHIYQPGFSFFKAQAVICQHYKMMYEAAIANHKNGTPYMNFREYWQLRNAEKTHKLQIANAVHTVPGMKQLLWQPHSFKPTGADAH